MNSPHEKALKAHKVQEKEDRGTSRMIKRAKTKSEGVKNTRKLLG